MKVRLLGAAALLGAGMLGGCAGYDYGPPPPGWVGEGWHRHVVRCLRHYPNYNPRTDRIDRPGGPVPCPL